jgi:hypothetical protein
MRRFGWDSVYFEPLRRNPVGTSGELVVLQVERQLNEPLDEAAEEDPAAWVAVEATIPRERLRIGWFDGSGIENERLRRLIAVLCQGGWVHQATGETGNDSCL